MDRAKSRSSSMSAASGLSIAGLSAWADEQDAGPTRFEIDAIGDMADAWRRGLRPTAEQWLSGHPEIEPRIAVRIIYEEVCLRQDHGERVDSVEVYRRFPHLRRDLEVLFDCHRLLETEPDFPEPGQRLGEFQLLREIDRGAVGRVFLAAQPMLSDRAIVIKLTPVSSDEHLSLARLQHSHIVPLYLVQDFPQQRLKALCMPYLGGASWARLLQGLGKIERSQRSGRTVAQLLAKHDEPTSEAMPGPALRFLQRASFVQAVCWIGACLADALHYAHQRGLIHLDVKPSNVLLAGDGQPMLLDFHLAKETIAPGSDCLGRLGGTREYMSPEQREAIAHVAAGRPVDVGVDGRSDIYSLGVLLYESLCDELPAASNSPAAADLMNRNPAISRGLADVLAKCLAHESSDRYRDAGELAADLRRHIVDLPLRGVPNRSLRERWQKWRRRRPQALVFGGLTTVALVVGALVTWLFWGERLQEASRALTHGKEELESRDLVMAIDEFKRGQVAAAWLPGARDLKQALSTELAIARHARMAESLHAMVEQLRQVEPFDGLALDERRNLSTSCESIWQVRSQILPASGAPASRRHGRLESDLLDLALLWAELKISLPASAASGDPQRQALRLLDEAEALCGPCAILDLVREEYASRFDAPTTNPIKKALRQPVSAWEHDAVGRVLLRSGKLPEAQAEFQQAIDLEPNAFWPHFHQASCCYRREDFSRAVIAASVCIALAPDRGECFYNRALAQQALGERSRALSDFNRALELTPTLTVAEQARDKLLEALRQSAK